MGDNERITVEVERGIVKFTDRRKKAYLARYRDKQRKEYRRSFERLGDARRWLSEKRASIERGDHIDGRGTRELFHDFSLRWAEAQDWKQTTRESFPSVLRRIESVLPKDVRLGDIDQLVVQSARTALGTQYKPRTVDLTMKQLNGVLRTAFHSGRIQRDPTIGSGSRRRSDRAKKVGPDDVPTRDDVLAIWSAAPPPYRAAVALGAAGMRIGEVIGLTEDRIDLENRRVTIDRQLQRIGMAMDFTPPKGGREFGEKVRIIRVPEAVAVELRRHLREHGASDDHGLLFVGGRDARLRRDYFYSSAWRPALTAAGFDEDRYVFHSLRHFCASSMLAANVNPMAVAGYLGDTLETLQSTYAHWLRDDQDIPADALEAILSAGRSADATGS